MKVLHINFQDTGGAAIASKTLHEELLRQGVHSSYLCLNLKETYSKEKRYFEHRRIYTSFFRKFYYLHIKTRWIHFFEKRFLSKTKERNEFFTYPYTPFDITLDPLYQEADIIHLHWISRFVDYPSFFRKNKKPIIWTLHDKNPISGILHCSTFFPDYAVAIENHYLNLKKKWLKKSNITFVAPSEQYFNYAKETELGKLFKVEKIIHGIDSSIFHPLDKVEVRKQLGLPINNEIILSVATDTERPLKGFKEIIEIARNHHDKLFLFIGHGKNHNHLSNVKYIGEISDQIILNKYYNAADVVISNSLEESFGLTIAEALMAGSTIETREVGIVQDILNENQTIDSNILKHGYRIIPSNKFKNMFEMIDNGKKYYNLYQQLLN